MEYFNMYHCGNERGVLYDIFQSNTPFQLFRVSLKTKVLFPQLAGVFGMQKWNGNTSAEIESKQSEYFRFL